MNSHFAFKVRPVLFCLLQHSEIMDFCDFKSQRMFSKLLIQHSSMWRILRIKKDHLK